VEPETARELGHAGFALGLISTAVQVGNTFGPALGAFSVDSLGFRGSFALGGLMLLAGALVSIFWVDEPKNQIAPARVGPAESIWARTFGPFGWPGFRALLVLQLGTSFCYSAAVNLLPIYLQDMDRPSWLSAELVAAAGEVGLDLGITELLDRLGQVRAGASGRSLCACAHLLCIVKRLFRRGFGLDQDPLPLLGPDCVFEQGLGFRKVRFR